jgi:4-diphosphocytidyl-2-C-methyl-D-erythritol kinase
MQKDWLALKAPAKINLFLRVTGRRGDGYHTLETLMQKVDLYDELALRLCEQPGIHLRCVGSALPEDKGNLVYRAAELFLQTVSPRVGSVPGVIITLTKNIPVAAGLGGGSSDAAATLRGLDELLGCGCSGEELASLGLRLGADVPFFLVEASAAFATGIGEVLTPVAPLSGYSVLLVNPGFSVSTQWVYQTFALTENKKTSNIKNSWKGLRGVGVPDGGASDAVQLAAMHNDLEAVTASRYPKIEQLKAELVANGATAALMSGSGPTVFGLFADRQLAEICQAICMHRFEHTYLVSPLPEKR